MSCAVDQDRALDPDVLDQVVHPVEAAQQGGLAAPGRADEGGDGLLPDGQRHVAEGLEIAVPEVEPLDLDLGARAAHPNRPMM